MARKTRPTTLVFDHLTPKLFVDYDGTLHQGHVLLDANDVISLDSRQPIFEYAPILAEMVELYAAC